MSLFEALLLGIVQGLTEFLPVSSSGHLQLFQHLFGLENLDQYVFFDVICHLGTLAAIFIVFYRTLLNLTFNQVKLIIIGTLPLFPMVLGIKQIKHLFDRPDLLGYFFLTTALLLYLGIRFGKEKSREEKERTKVRDAFSVGLFQALALAPGISRSGSTISGARLMGWSVNEAITFSFLLAIPAILGSVTLEGFTAFKEGLPPQLSPAHYLIGFFSSLFVGYAALLWLIALASKDKFMYFVGYCAIIGIISLYAFNR